MSLKEEQSFFQVRRAYEDYLEVLGCKHIRVPHKQNKSTGSTSSYGQWTIGPNGTYIFTYIESYWPQLVQMQIMQ